MGNGFTTELSYATGLLKANSIIGNILDKMTKLTISNSSSIVALDDDMKNYLISKNNDSKNVVVCPVWTVMEDFYEEVVWKIHLEKNTTSR